MQKGRCIVMKRKHISAIVLSVVLGMSTFLGGCGNREETTTAPEESIKTEEGTESASEVRGEVQMWDGYYEDTSTGLLSFIHFYEDGTYYAKYFDGSVLDAGTYQVLEEEMEYNADSGADGDFGTEDDNTKATASHVVEMTSYQSGTAVKVAFTDDQLCDMSLGGMANHRTLTHNAEYVYDPDVDETAIELFVFYADNNIGSNFILSHNRTFVDVTGDTFQDGSWEMTEAGTYTLIYSDGTEAVLTVGADGRSAILTKSGGDELALKDTYEEGGDLSGAVILSLVAEDVEAGLPMGVDLRLDCYGDNTCKLIVEVSQIGAEIEADQGTYSVTESYQYTFNFVNAGNVAGTPDYASATENSLDVAAVYKADMEVEFNGSVTPLSIDSELKGTYVMGGAVQAAEVVNTLTADDAEVGLPMGVNLRIDIYSDDTCKLIVEVAQLGAELEADQGTCTLDETNFKYTFDFEKAGELISEPDYASATAEGLDMTLAYKAETEVEFNGTSTPLSIDTVLQGRIAAQ